VSTADQILAVKVLALVAEFRAVGAIESADAFESVFAPLIAEYTFFMERRKAA
jgi:hypothetical protein